MPKQFSEVMREMRNGVYDQIATEKLSQVVCAVRETGKKGKITISLGVSANGDGSVKIDVDVNGKIPASDLGTAIMFIDQDGGLHRTDIRQIEMFKGRRAAIDIDAQIESVREEVRETLKD